MQKPKISIGEVAIAVPHPRSGITQQISVVAAEYSVASGAWVYNKHQDSEFHEQSASHVLRKGKWRKI